MGNAASRRQLVAGVSLRFPDQGHGPQAARLRAGGDRHSLEARAGFRSRVRADAAEPQGSLSQRYLHRARDLARAARRALPGAVRPPRGSHGAMTIVADIVVKRLGRVEYTPTLEAMRRFTRGRDDGTADELWLLEHPPVYTLGQGAAPARDRKSTRLNSSHLVISYAVFCLKKKKNKFSTILITHTTNNYNRK